MFETAVNCEDLMALKKVLKNEAADHVRRKRRKKASTMRVGRDKRRAT
jgi:hypothetical protein